MHVVAGAGERAGHPEEHHLLALEDIVRAFPCRAVRGHDAKLGLRQSIADLDGHWVSLPDAQRKTRTRYTDEVQLSSS